MSYFFSNTFSRGNADENEFQKEFARKKFLCKAFKFFMKNGSKNAHYFCKNALAGKSFYSCENEKPLTAR